MSYSRSKFGDITSQNSFRVGRFSVGTSAATFANGPLNSGVRINPEGSATITIGSDANGTEATGYDLDGEVFIDIDDLNKVFVIADATGSTISFVAS